MKYFIVLLYFYHKILYAKKTVEDIFVLKKVAEFSEFSHQQPNNLGR
jgi:hypothetical protein